MFIRKNVAEVRSSIVELVLRKARHRKNLMGPREFLWAARGQRVLCSNFVPNKTNSFKGAGVSGIRPPCW